jgi:hypothetical protein
MELLYDLSPSRIELMVLELASDSDLIEFVEFLLRNMSLHFDLLQSLLACFLRTHHQRLKELSTEKSEATETAKPRAKNLQTEVLGKLKKLQERTWVTVERTCLASLSKLEREVGTS